MVERKANTRFYCLRKLGSFGVSISLLATILNAIVCRALSFGLVCCGGNISKHERRKLDQIVTKGGQAVGISGQSIDKVYSRGSDTNFQLSQTTPHILCTLTFTAAEWKQVEDCESHSKEIIG